MSAPVGFLLDALPAPQPIFRAIAGRGDVAAADMYAVYNMGVGMCAIVAEVGVDSVIAAAAREGKEAWRIGTVTSDADVVRIVENPLTGVDLVSNGKQFRAG